MITLSYDLHIHSCLSPCGDDDMTPANIVGMAALKELDVIALTDHNSCKNCPPVLELAEEYGVLAIPGMEINTVEEVHAVCLFPELDNAMAFDAYVYDRLLRIENNPDVFGKQQVMDASENVLDTVPYLLISAANISFDSLWDLVQEYDGVMFPAHIDKSANSLLSNLGFIPPESKFACAEIYKMERFHGLKDKNPYLEKCRILSNSDAHYLGDLHEPYYTLQAEGRTRKDIIESLRRPLEV